MPNKAMPSYTVRTMQLSDCKEVLQMWLSVDSDVYKYIIEMMVITDAEGSYVAQDITTGKLLGVCCGVNLSSELSYMCIYAVLKEYQGLGVGTTLWDKVIEHMGDRNISLYVDSKKMQENYKTRHNFKADPQRRGLIMKGKPVVNALTDSICGICLVDMNDKNIADVIEYDKQVCDGLDRSAQLRALNGQFKTASLVAINDNNQVMGYCFVWELVSGILSVSPLYADNQQIAELLVGKCLQRIHNWETKEIYYLCWNSNHESIEIANKLCLKFDSSFQLMFSKRIISGKLNKIYTLDGSAVYPF